MDSISSISFPNEPLISSTQRWTFLDHFCHHFWVGLVLLCCCTHPKVMTKMVKKCSTLCLTDQRFIRKRNTTYRIHTFVRQQWTEKSSKYILLTQYLLIYLWKFEPLCSGFKILNKRHLHENYNSVTCSLRKSTFSFSNLRRPPRE